MLEKTAVKEDARMRLQGQHVPGAPRTAHGQMSFVFSAPVCLFPVPPPAGQLEIRVVQPSYAASLGPSKRAATWMKSEAVPLVTIVALFRYFAKSWNQNCKPCSNTNGLWGLEANGLVDGRGRPSLHKPKKRTLFYFYRRARFREFLLDGLGFFL